MAGRSTTCRAAASRGTRCRSATIERVELVRGGASPVWGDAALGGVVNVITRGARATGAHLSAAGGTFGTWRLDAAARTAALAHGAGVSGGGHSTAGFREHSARTVWRGGGDVALLADDRRRVTLSAAGHGRELEEPGPLAEAELAQGRTASDPFYRFDRTEDRAVRAGADVLLGVGAAGLFTGALGYEHRATDAVRTLVLAPQFADTKERVLRTGRLGGSAQVALEDTGLPLDDRLVIGVDAARGSIDAKYYGVVAGPRVVYGAASGERGKLDTAGDGGRTSTAAFAHYTVRRSMPCASRSAPAPTGSAMRSSRRRRRPGASRRRTRRSARAPA
jgi:outer membrane receptor protein involved in Fe transport